MCMGDLLTIAPQGQISIGEWCYLGPNSKIWSMESINIGNKVFISHGVHLFDNNSHSLSAEQRHLRYRELQEYGRHLESEPVKHQPIIIEDDVWIGFNAAIMKGVRVGQGAVVAACAVVTHDVAPFTVVAGNPAKPVGVAGK
jgi:acetyltransferase-like isoleucine patch superfamily enzyme